MICPDCGSSELLVQDGHFPECANCGHAFYPESTLALIAKVRREQALCKQILGYTPTYAEAVEKGLVRQ